MSRIQSEYLLAPKRERRQLDRRNQDRRSNKRRNINVKSTSPSNRFAWPHLLSDDERQMLNDIMQDD